MNFLINAPIKLFDQVDGYGDIHNVLGFGDPHVVKIKNQWWMFISGFQTNFKNNIFTATLPEGKTLSSNEWKITTQSGHPKKANPIFENSEKGSWDYFGFHTPFYVSGRGTDGDIVERVYYTGRGSRKVVDNTSPYSIGVIEKREGVWKRHPTRILAGTKESPNVLESKVSYIEGKWRMWYVTTKKETGKKGTPQYCVKYVESDDGLHNWSQPKTLFNEDENYYDATIHKSYRGGYGMAVCRSTNLYGRHPFPKQGLWLLEGAEPNGDRGNWSRSPKLILDCDEGAEWYRNGIGYPNGCYGESKQDQDKLYLFFTGIHQKRNWLNISLSKLMKGKRPPFPSPFYFTIGKVELKRLKE
ncbi:hypothetical protein FZC78_02705 [Rossellomorea vietnamensis]|uniref:Uncharacterized protein n=1 Tax=Rossellomorea vietnamensis TaxID=218284 RepID=A0A5D4NW32_9BACI|nr:hypothetical protein [Rossellomorea vietnamensis]TYS18467.1 hypothetical protein FZC78_02705 [Rossellomorea vietnamensis]